MRSIAPPQVAGSMSLPAFVLYSVSVCFFLAREVALGIVGATPKLAVDSVAQNQFTTTLGAGGFLPFQSLLFNILNVRIVAHLNTRAQQSAIEIVNFRRRIACTAANTLQIRAQIV